MQEFKLPDLGEGMQEAEIRRWLVQPGDTVKIDQPMVEVETDKAVVEIPAPLAGRIANIRVPAGSIARLGEVLVEFASTADELLPASPAAAAEKLSPASPATTAQGNGSKASTSTPAPADLSSLSSSPSSSPTAQSRVLASPAVRKRAFELGVDLAGVIPSQPHGRVTMDDLLAYAEHAQRETPTSVTSSTIAPHDAPLLATSEPEATNGSAVISTSPPATELTTPSTSMPAEERREALSGLRRRIAEHMERSWRTIPHASAFDELDGTELVALRHALKPLAQQRGLRLTYLPLLLKLLLPLLKEFPIFNASLDESRHEIVYKQVYHIGIAADSPEGLLVPVLRNADRLSIAEIARQLEHLVEGARTRKLSRAELSGSTFTLNNIGSFGGSSGTPIINYPEVAILAVGRLQEKAVVRDGTLVARTMLPLALSFDHRLIDGALAGRFLARFKDLVEQPQQLLLDLV